jgi:predicted nucleic acid-binding protein
MASDPPVVVYDACVLYPFHLRNLLIQLAVEGLVAARWTDAIHDEWIRSLANTGAVSRERLLATRDLMKAILSEADIRDYKRHEGAIALPDPDDHHVLAAAIEAHASIILTWNLKHFPESETAKHNIAVRDPDSFLTALCGDDAETVAAVVDAARANLRLSEPTAEEYLQALENQGLKSFVSLIRATSSGGP